MFVDKIFKITEIEKFKINVSMGKIKAKIDKKIFLLPIVKLCV